MKAIKRSILTELGQKGTKNWREIVSNLAVHGKEIWKREDGYTGVKLVTNDYTLLFDDMKDLYEKLLPHCEDIEDIEFKGKLPVLERNQDFDYVRVFVGNEPELYGKPRLAGQY